MKFVKIAGQTIEGATWLLLHLLAHILLVAGVIVELLNQGIKASLTLIRQLQEGLVAKLGEK